MLAAGVREHAVQPDREHPDPREDECERDEFEGRERHALEDEDDRRRHERAAEDVREQHEARRVVPAAHDDGDEHTEEREDDAVGGALVQELVDVDGEESHGGEVGAGAAQQNADLAGALGSAQVLESMHVAAHLQREAEEQHADDDHGEVERVSGEVAERAELAELSTPPRGVGGGEHRQCGADDEQDRDQRGPARARQTNS